MEFNWQLLIPFIIIQFILMTIALFDLFKKQPDKESKWVWVFIIVVINIFGPVMYFIIGRRNN